MLKKISLVRVRCDNDLRVSTNLIKEREDPQTKLFNQGKYILLVFENPVFLDV
jgi:hypothetical protein